MINNISFDLTLNPIMRYSRGNFVQSIYYISIRNQTPIRKLPRVFLLLEQRQLQCGILLLLPLVHQQVIIKRP